VSVIPLEDGHESFRDALASVHKDGRRKWVYARQPSGRFYRARTAVSVLLLAFLVAAPFVEVQGQPLILLNVLERRFVLFGLVFWPQDFHLVVLLALTAIVTLALSTAAVGRVWCGWLCPQTVFLEMVFRRLEYLIDGSAERQVRRDARPWTAADYARAALKHAIFFGLSFAIANLFLAYVIGVGPLWTIVTDPPSQHLGGLVAITIFSLLFYGVFARFREQACVLACPYGRVMSSLIDRRTITVTYDTARGEPRGRVSRDRAAGSTGDCVDCSRCVTVCPTGIDIRNGIQLECVNCTACMDACDAVMRQLHRPTGLIGYRAHEAARRTRLTWLTPRVAAYGAVWLVLVATVVTLLARRRDLDVLILRQPGTLFAELADGDLANFYTVQVLNRSARAHALDYRAVSPAGARLTPLGAIDRVGAHGLIESRFFLQVPREGLRGGSTPVRFEVRADGVLLETIDSSFLGPGPASVPGAAPASPVSPPE
jgi:cytochrome c oxidase accessory protein FixG